MHLAPTTALIVQQQDKAPPIDSFTNKDANTYFDDGLRKDCQLE